jgi:hypothetical protein
MILALVLSLGALAWVVWPLIDRKPAPVLVEDDRFAGLIARKDAVLTAIRDLEFDYKLGKIDEEDFQRYEARLRKQAIGLIQQIEQVAPASTSLDASVEQEVLRRRKVVDGDGADAVAPTTRGAAPGVAAGASRVAATSALPAAVAAAGANGATRKFCTACGAPLEANYRFCGVCGTAVAQPGAQPDAQPVVQAEPVE